MKQSILFFLLIINLSVFGQTNTPPDDYLQMNYLRQLLPGKDYTFDAMHHNTKNLKLEIYRLPDSVSMTVFNTIVAKEFREILYLAPTDIPASLLTKKAKVWSRDLSPDSQKELEVTPVPIRMAKPGYYILVARKWDGTLIKGAYFAVSNVTAVYKRIGGHWYVYALNGLTGKPLENFEWMTFQTQQDGRLLPDTSRSGKINQQNGFTRLFPVSSKQEDKLYGVLKSNENHYSIPLLLNDILTKREPDQVLKLPGILTDRPFYEPGDTVYYKVFRPALPENQRMEANKKLKILLKGNGLTFRDTLKFNAWGSASGTMVLPLSAKGGIYVFYADGKDVSTISVQASKKPLLEINLDSIPVPMLGDSIRVTGRVSYANGAPFVHKMIGYKISGASFLLQNREVWWISDSVTCDEDGRFRIKVASTLPKRIAGLHKRCNLQLSVRDGAFYRREVKETLFLRTKTYRLDWKAQPYIINGDSLPPIRAYDREEKEVQIPGEYTLRKDTTVIQTGTFMSGAPFVPDWGKLPSGYYTLTYTAPNGFGPRVSFTLLSRTAPISESMRGLFYIPRNKICFGEDVSFVVATKTKNLLARVNVYDDSMRLVQTRQFVCAIGVHSYVLKLDAQPRNNVRIEFMASEDGNFISTIRELTIDCPLQVKIEKIQPRIMGKSKQHLRIQVKGELDKGEQSELMLTVYQKSKNQREYAHLHPISYTRFHMFRTQSIVTNMSNNLKPVEYEKKFAFVRITLDGDSHEEFSMLTPRKYYKSSDDYYPENTPHKLIFVPHLMTDSSGLAEFSFDVPDVNGTYVVEVCAKNRRMQTVVTKEEFVIVRSRPDSLALQGYPDSIRAYVSSKSSLVGNSLVDLKPQELFREGVFDERMTLYMLPPRYLLLNELGLLRNTTSEFFPDQLNAWFVNGMGSVVWAEALQSGVKKMNPEFERAMVSARNKKCLHQIQSAQNKDGGYSWYRGMPSSVLCTELFFTRYLGLVECGYYRGMNFSSKMYVKALFYLDKWIVSEYQERTKYPGTKTEVSSEVLNYLFIRSCYPDSTMDVETKRAYGGFMTDIRAGWKKYSLEAKAQVAAVLSKCGEDVSPILKVLKGDVAGNSVRTNATLLALWNRESGDYAGEIAQSLMLQRKERAWKDCFTQPDAVWALWKYYSGNKQISYATESKFSGASGLTKFRGESFPGMSIDLKRVKKNAPEFMVRSLDEGVVFADLVYRYRKVIQDQQIKCSDGYTLKVSYWKEAPDVSRVALTSKSYLKKGDVLVVSYEITTDTPGKLSELTVDHLQNLALVNPYSEYSGSGYYRDIRDKKILFFFEGLAKGTKRIEERYVVRKDGNMPPMQIQISSKGMY